MMSKDYNRLPPNKDREVLNNSSFLEGLRALVVDDNEDTLLLTSFILEEYAIQVNTATSASEALKKFAKTKPDILICDIAMPVEDGYSLIRKIRKQESEQRAQTPAIALTASARDEDQDLSIQAGFQIHLAKPIEPEELVKTVVSLTSRLQYSVNR